jgi:valyl-tRNA synthetase
LINFQFFHPMLDKAYDAKKYEDAIYKKWEESGAFKANVDSGKPSFTISMPPPNATGVLHLGHSVMLALEDTVTRHRRMKGYETLYLPGTDHAAIATENVVIRNLQEQEGIKDPRSLGRAKLVERIAEFVAKSQGTIRSQIRKMGTSCDWSRERYTMDPSLNRCVNEAFKKMYEDGLIYRAERVVNWDVALQTTLADDEVEYKEQEGTLYTIEYISAKQTGGEPIYVSTSRPETKLGDNALAVNPDDERYSHLIGRTFDVVWPGGQKINVTVIADHDVDKEFGTGVVGVTPFHSKVDYDMWLRHRKAIKSEPIQVIDEQGKIKAGIKGYAGLSVFKAREKFVEELRAEGKIKEEKKYVQQMSISYRSKKPIEPLPKLQWFVDVNKKVVQWSGAKGKKKSKMSLKEVMLEVVKSGEIKIIPDRFEKTYYHWIENLQDWCVSRQIWWGHRIPVWYKGEETYVGMTAPEGAGWKQDEDTLDTWFSSAMWTWSTLVDQKLTDDLSLSFEVILKGSADYQKFHPTTLMETGYDIIFFWVARMILMTTYMTGKIPFETVYLHGLIRTRDGKKMSKSDPKTCIDPLDMIEKYGCDALRMSMVIGNSPGNDMRLYEEKIMGYRNFTNKLWNASRFVIGVLEEKGINKAPELDLGSLSDADEWILSRIYSTIQGCDEALTAYRISEAGQLLYDFLWNDFCDWYLELSKGDKQNPAVLYHVLATTLKLLHPIIPFVTEQIWSELPGTTSLLITEPYPVPLSQEFDAGSIELITELIGSIRRMRAENKIEPAQKIPVTLYGRKDLEVMKEDIMRLARISELTWEASGKKLSGAAADTVQGIQIFIPLGGLVDTEKEKARLQKEMEQLGKYIAVTSAKLANTNFVQNAPEMVVSAEKQRLAEAEVRMKQMKEQVGNL